MKKYLKELLLQDNQNLTNEEIDYYINGIVKELKFCRITQKSVNKISLHEFKCCEKDYNGVYVNFYNLLVQIAYNGDFYHSFNVYRVK